MKNNKNLIDNSIQVPNTEFRFAKFNIALEENFGKNTTKPIVNTITKTNINPIKILK